jgi:hypothetical protein
VFSTIDVENLSTLSTCNDNLQYRFVENLSTCKKPEDRHDQKGRLKKYSHRYLKQAKKREQTDHLLIEIHQDVKFVRIGETFLALHSFPQSVWISFPHQYQNVDRAKKAVEKLWIECG